MKITMAISIAISSALVALFSNLMEKSPKKKETKTSFECGFEPLADKKMSFSTNFLLLMMMFLIFDVEISVLIPFLTMNKNNQTLLMLTSAIFIGALTIMLMKEWKQGSLEWSK